MRQASEGTQGADTRAAPWAAQARRLVMRYPVMFGIAAGLAVCSAALAVLLLTHRGGASTDTPTPSASAICVDLRTQAYDALYVRLSPPLQALGGKDQFVASQRQIDTLRGAVTGCSFRFGHVDAQSADVTFALTRTRAGTLSGQAHFALVGGEWRLDRYDADVL